MENKETRNKGNAQFVQKVTFEPLMYFKQNHYGSWKLLKHRITFFVTVLFNILILFRQTSIAHFWGLQKNMTCAFPLKSRLVGLIQSCTSVVFAVRKINLRLIEFVERYP